MHALGFLLVQVVGQDSTFLLGYVLAAHITALLVVAQERARHAQVKRERSQEITLSHHVHAFQDSMKHVKNRINSFYLIFTRDKLGNFMF